MFSVTMPHPSSLLAMMARPSPPRESKYPAAADGCALELLMTPLMAWLLVPLPVLVTLKAAVAAPIVPLYGSVSPPPPAGACQLALPSASLQVSTYPLVPALRSLKE